MYGSFLDMTCFLLRDCTISTHICMNILVFKRNTVHSSLWVGCAYITGTRAWLTCEEGPLPFAAAGDPSTSIGDNGPLMLTRENGTFFHTSPKNSASYPSQALCHASLPVPDYCRQASDGSAAKCATTRLQAEQSGLRQVGM